jgi:hypothetical protein
MTNLVTRVFCPECGVIRIHAHRSRYALCPNGHGKLVPGFTAAERRKAIAKRFPRAWCVGHNVFVIESHSGRFAYRGGNGRRAVALNVAVQDDEVLARHVTRARTMIRIFTRIDFKAT